MDINFDFLVSPPLETDTAEPEYVGPNIKAAAKMTPKKFAQAVLEVFDRLGGASWLIMQAQADPKAFLSLLQRLIPKSIQLDDLQGVQINLIDQFGNRIEIEAAGRSPQDAVLRGGSPLKEVKTPVSQPKPQLSSVAIKDIF